MSSETVTSTETDIGSSTESTSDGSRWRNRGRRGAHSGTALVARGESMVWMTAGSLAICLMMIVGLLLLIFARGVTTFWPRPLVQVELHDGSVHLGEVDAVESFELTPSVAETYSPEIEEAALAELGGAESQLVRRRLLRTGNFRLTNQHFNWVEDVAIVPGRESLPEWAMLLERLEWGRFYGFPMKLEVAIPRPVSGEEERLAGAVRFLESNWFRLDDESRTQGADALEKAKQRLGSLRAKSFEAFRADAEKQVAESGGDLIARLASGEVKPLDELAESDDVEALVQSWDEPEAVWNAFTKWHPEATARYARRRGLEKHDIGLVNAATENARLDVREVELEDDVSWLVTTATQLGTKREALANFERELQAFEDAAKDVERLFDDESTLPAAAQTMLVALRAEYAGNEDFRSTNKAIATEESRLKKASERGRAAIEAYLATSGTANAEDREIRAQIDELNTQNERLVLTMETAQGEVQPFVLSDIVRAYPANRLTNGEKWAVYGARWWEFLSDEPRFANQEGGVFPAIWGTVVMTIVMSLAVVPFGVLAALYLREYAKSGPIVSAVRIAVNNLAGVPSIVFGVFGLGFFCYIIGAYVDGGPENAGLTTWPAPKWWIAVAALAVTALGAFLVGLSTLAGPMASRRTWWSRQAGSVSFVLWIVATVLLVVVIATVPEFGGFYRARLPNPTFGTGGLLWASFTLALLTLPVVIVATEEALAAVPNSMREGSYACGASKWQTIRRIILPRAMPGITTGMILAMARGAGEVAPLMLVGVLKLAPELPVDAVAPFVHLDRSFMHLGFHIYDLGFQSQNSEAAKPMVFTTTLLLITLIGLLNLTAIALRARLKRRFRGTQF